MKWKYRLWTTFAWRQKKQLYCTFERWSKHQKQKKSNAFSRWTAAVTTTLAHDLIIDRWRLLHLIIIYSVLFYSLYVKPVDCNRVECQKCTFSLCAHEINQFVAVGTTRDTHFSCACWLAGWPACDAIVAYVNRLVVIVFDFIWMFGAINWCDCSTKRSKSLQRLVDFDNDAFDWAQNKLLVTCAVRTQQSQQIIV